MRAPIHLPFQEFETRNLPFHLSLAPRKRQRRFDGGVIALDARSKSPQFHRGTLVSPCKPAVQSPHLPLLDHLHTILPQLIEFGEICIEEIVTDPDPPFDEPPVPPPCELPFPPPLPTAPPQAVSKAQRNTSTEHSLAFIPSPK